jgi:copper resistance protein C
MKNMKHPGFIAFIAALVLAFGATAAYAHVTVTSRSPGQGTTVKKTLKTVKVTFSGTIRSGTLKVYGPRGGKVSKGNGGRDPRNIRRLTVGLKSGLKVGKYTVKWTIVAADGHAKSGSYWFKLKS